MNRVLRVESVGGIQCGERNGGRNPDRNPRIPPPFPPDAFPPNVVDPETGEVIVDENEEGEEGEVETQQEQLEDAENALNGENTDGEDTLGDEFDDGEDDGPAVSATAGDGVAEASTPNAIASAGDPDDLQPLRSTPDDVVDEIDTGDLPLPNTRGAELWVYPMVGAGSLLLLGALIRRMWRAE